MPLHTVLAALSLRPLAAPASGLLLALFQGGGVPVNPVRVMPLGDSITESTAGLASFRYWLWTGLDEAGYCVDFVGTMRGVFGGSPAFESFDQDHEGHRGWRADEVLLRIDEWAAAEDPDVVLVHLGTNDLRQGKSPDSTILELGSIVDELRLVNPEVRVLLAQIIPMGPSVGVDVEPFNALVPGLAAALDRPESPVVVVDQFTGFDAATDTYDDIHPNQTGERKIAERWYAELTALLASNCIGTRYCSPNALNSTGSPGRIYVDGSRVAADDDLTLIAAQLPPGPNMGYFMVGTGTNTVVPPGGAGSLCILPGPLRMSPPVSNTAEERGGFRRSVGTSGPISSQFVAGSTWNFQAWHRDYVIGVANLTDAVSVTFQ